MTTSDPGGTTTAYVWVWLDDRQDPVVAGRLRDHGSIVSFAYGQSYLGRDVAVPLYLPELPLERGEHDPLSGRLAGAIADAGPGAWGRRIIEHRRTRASTDLGELDYLLASGSDRIGALDFQTSSEHYEPRGTASASLDDLATAAARVEAGEPLPRGLDEALLHGSSVGGARPKALLDDGEHRLIAKFSSANDPVPVVSGEFVAMTLARQAGLDVAPVQLTSALGKEVLLVERFDRSPGGGRRMMVSALTVLELHDADGMAGRYATYVDLAHEIRRRFDDPADTLRELFARLCFNVLVGNTDDHARNHAAIWQPRSSSLSLTPAYDICPQTRTGGEAAQAMAYGDDGERRAQVARCVDHAGTFHVSPVEARAIVDHQIATIHDGWGDACDRARLSVADRERLWGRQFLNPYALEDWS